MSLKSMLSMTSVRRLCVLTAAAVFAMLLPAPGWAQTTGRDFQYEPQEGPVGTVITVSGVCEEEDRAGDAIALYRAADGALVDYAVQLGNGQPDPTTWTTELTVNPRFGLDGSGPETTPGDYELRLFCDIGSSWRPPDHPDATPRDWADVIKPFIVTSDNDECDGPVLIGGVDTGVTDRDVGDGCLSDIVGSPDDFPTHGSWVAHIARAGTELRRDGLLSGREFAEVLRSAVRSRR